MPRTGERGRGRLIPPEDWKNSAGEEGGEEGGRKRGEDRRVKEFRLSSRRRRHAAVKLA